jgi:hypothetical protein
MTKLLSNVLLVLVAGTSLDRFAARKGALIHVRCVRDAAGP